MPPLKPVSTFGFEVSCAKAGVSIRKMAMQSRVVRNFFIFKIILQKYTKSYHA